MTMPVMVILQKIQGMLFTAYSQGFNSDNSLYGSLGVGLGVTNRSVDKNALLYGDQWNDRYTLIGLAQMMTLQKSYILQFITWTLILD